MIKVVNEKDEKEYIIRLCDNAFEVSIYDRYNGNEIISKIINYADFFVAYVDEEVAGYVAMYNNDLNSKIAYITKVGVRKKYQGKHIGTSLINKCKEEAREKGMNGIRLEVDIHNERAIRLYKNAGFLFEKKCSESSIYMNCDI